MNPEEPAPIVLDHADYQGRRHRNARHRPIAIGRHLLPVRDSGQRRNKQQSHRDQRHPARFFPAVFAFVFKPLEHKRGNGDCRKWSSDAKQRQPLAADLSMQDGQQHQRNQHIPIPPRTDRSSANSKSGPWRHQQRRFPRHDGHVRLFLKQRRQRDEFLRHNAEQGQTQSRQDRLHAHTHPRTQNE